MQKRILLVAIVLAWLSFGSRICVAQEVVHALTGTVSATNPTAHTITVKTDDGSEGLFKVMGATQAKISLDKGIEAQTKPADQFTTVGSYVIVYFFGDGDVRTAVAVKDLGAAPVQRCIGTVTKFDRHHHLLTLKDNAGQTEEITVDENTSVDTTDGVVQGLKYEANKGDQVRVIRAAANGQNTALFIYAD